MSAAKKQLNQFMHQGSQKVFLKTLKQARMIFMIFVAFSFCWSPYIIVLLLDKNDKWPLEVHLYTCMVAHIHASINFIIYGLTTKAFRTGYRKFVCGMCTCLSKKTVEVNTVHSTVTSSADYMDDVKTHFLAGVRDVTNRTCKHCCQIVDEEEYYQDDVVSDHRNMALMAEDAADQNGEVLLADERDLFSSSYAVENDDMSDHTEPEETRQTFV